jgi:hypothetical protein
MNSIEVKIDRLLNGAYSIGIRQAQHDQHSTTVTVQFDHQKLRVLLSEHDPIVYGQELTRQVFADPALRTFWAQASAAAIQYDQLAVRLRLDANDAQLHQLRWETLHDPEQNEPFALSQRYPLARTVCSAPLRQERASVEVDGRTGTDANFRSSTVCGNGLTRDGERPSRTDASLMFSAPLHQEAKIRPAD